MQLSPKLVLRRAISRRSDVFNAIQTYNNLARMSAYTRMLDALKELGEELEIKDKGHDPGVLQSHFPMAPSLRNA